MGWDALSSALKSDPDTGLLKILPKFNKASNEVKKQCGNVDFLLKYGGLDCSDCAEVLQSVTGKNCRDENGWNKDEVKLLAQSLEWPDISTINEEDRWAVLSAKAFLEVCAENSYSISFSW